MYKIFELSMNENGLNCPSKTVWKMVESQGKVIEKSGNFEKDIEWQPCLYLGFVYFKSPLKTGFTVCHGTLVETYQLVDMLW